MCIVLIQGNNIILMLSVLNKNEKKEMFLVLVVVTMLVSGSGDDDDDDVNPLTCKSHVCLTFELLAFFRYMQYIIQDSVYNDNYDPRCYFNFYMNNCFKV